MSAIPDKSIMCHRTGFAKSCREIVLEGQCRLWTHIRGMDNNTGAEIDRYGCADEFLPLLLIENSNLQRQTGAAVESLRNENVNSALSLVNNLVDRLPRLTTIGADPDDILKP